MVPMRAEQAMMVGVGILGAFAVYKLVTAKPIVTAPDNTPLAPGLPSIPNARTRDGVTLLGDPLNLQRGQYYQARLTVFNTEPFSSTATKEVLGKALATLGFADVRVFMSDAELPSGFPTSQVNSEAITLAGNRRYFQGVWNGPSISLPKPPTIEAIWPIARPANAIAVSGAGASMYQMTG
jgi:hypothetical protein